MQQMQQNGNVFIMIFALLQLDVIQPTMICYLTTAITAFPGNDVETVQFSSTNDPSADLISFPAIVSAGYEDVDTNPIVQFVATDASNNIASCKTQIKIEGL